MFAQRRLSNVSFGIPCTVALWVLILASAAPPPAWAETGAIAFRDDCTGLLYAMRGDGSGRIALPLPPLPQPAGEHAYRDPWILDVTTSGPLTAVYYVGIVRRNQSGLVDFGLFAVQLNEVDGVLRSDSPVRLTLPANVGFAGVNPNVARTGAFSSAAFRDRMALVARSPTASVLMTARVDRDPSSLKMRGLSDLVVVGDLNSIGVTDPQFPASQGFTGDIDYSPDGSRIVASIYHDLWVVQLSSDDTYTGAERLTGNSDGFAEWKPAFSPDGTRIAYTAGPITSSGGVRDTDIYSLTIGTGALRRVTSTKNKGDAASSRHNAIWRADGEWIGFSAFTSATPRHSPCSVLVNSELFLIKADGSNSAIKITNTVGTGVEAWPKWGW
jgi:WD40-like Beta Propeller Repeat